MASWLRNHVGRIKEKESWRRNLGGEIMEEESWKRNLGEGFMEEESWRRNHGGRIMKTSWSRYHGRGVMEEEASGSHLEEPSGVSLVGSRGALGSQGDHRRPRSGSEGNCAKTITFFCQKWRDRPFRVHGSVLTLTKSAACA